MTEQQILGSLYVTTPRAYLSIDHDSIRIATEQYGGRRVPLMAIDGAVAIEPRGFSFRLIERLVASGRSLSLLDGRGRFVARMTGPMSGNVLLRAAQYRASEGDAALDIARRIVLAKLQNQRRLLLRRSRDVQAGRAQLADVAGQLELILHATDAADSLDEVRGHEGDAARRYFGVFSQMVTAGGRDFHIGTRERRPPRGRMNALLSFLYVLATHEAVAAAEVVGLDPQIGYLHALRSGRPALALDLVECIRSPLCDRLALSLVNRRQIVGGDFDVFPGGAVYLSEDGRRTVLKAWAERRQDLVRHPLLSAPLPWGLIAHVQARLLARHLRGETATYPAFVAPE